MMSFAQKTRFLSCCDASDFGRETLWPIVSGRPGEATISESQSRHMRDLLSDNEGKTEGFDRSGLGVLDFVSLRGVRQSLIVGGWYTLANSAATFWGRHGVLARDGICRRTEVRHKSATVLAESCSLKKRSTENASHICSRIAGTNLSAGGPHAALQGNGSKGKHGNYARGVWR